MLNPMGIVKSVVVSSVWSVGEIIRHLFANDALIPVTHLLTQLSNEIDNIYEWVCKIKLKLNISKTKYT